MTQEELQAIRDGNSAAFKRLFDSCYEDLCRYAFTLLRDADEAKDIVQTMFVKLWEKRESLEIRLSIRSYLFRSVYNQCMNQIDHRSVMRKHSDHITSTPEPAVDPDVFPAELEMQIRRVVDSMPPQCRTIFIMSRYDEMKYPDIATRLNISVNTIQNQVCKALKILRDELKDTFV